MRIDFFNWHTHRTNAEVFIYLVLCDAEQTKSQFYVVSECTGKATQTQILELVDVTIFLIGCGPTLDLT